MYMDFVLGKQYTYILKKKNAIHVSNRARHNVTPNIISLGDLSFWRFSFPVGHHIAYAVTASTTYDLAILW